MLAAIGVGAAMVLLVVRALAIELLSKNGELVSMEFENPLYAWFLHGPGPFGYTGLILGNSFGGARPMLGFLAGLVVFAVVALGVATLGIAAARSRFAVLVSTWLAIGVGAGLAGMVSFAVSAPGVPSSGSETLALWMRRGLAEGYYWGFLVGLLVGLAVMALWRPHPGSRPGAGSRQAPGALMLAGGVAMACVLVLVLSTLVGEFLDSESTRFGSEHENPLFVFVFQGLVPLGQTGLINDNVRSSWGWLPGFLLGLVAVALVVFALTWRGLRHGITGVGVLLQVWLAIAVGTGVGAVVTASAATLQAKFVDDRPVFGWAYSLRASLDGGYYWGVYLGLGLGLLSMILVAARSRSRSPSGSASGPPGTQDWENREPR
ncbi:MFS family permease [Nocardioides daedukensis]|uniref:MFS family permease n=1 Tax=Nocardioides daedukensis TaxID=634462 RepID=A0A7Y9S1M5_9ACTN|nr:hypothetical protein [Nocardioides daedukensis]NYG58089.1 MFS family permease [Nocardioides daedukensis]